jgi:hypothetical protein
MSGNGIPSFSEIFTQTKKEKKPTSSNTKNAKPSAPVPEPKIDEQGRTIIREKVAQSNSSILKSVLGIGKEDEQAVPVKRGRGRPPKSSKTAGPPPPKFEDTTEIRRKIAAYQEQFADRLPKHLTGTPPPNRPMMELQAYYKDIRNNCKSKKPPEIIKQIFCHGMDALERMGPAFVFLPAPICNFSQLQNLGIVARRQAETNEDLKDTFIEIGIEYGGWLGMDSFNDPLVKLGLTVLGMVITVNQMNSRGHGVPAQTPQQPVHEEKMFFENI